MKGIDMKNSYYNKLEKEYAHYNRVLKYRYLYNLKNSIIKAACGLGIGLDVLFPYILSFVITFATMSEYNNPFKIEKIEKYPYVCEIDMKDHIHLESKTYNAKYKDNRVEYSTGWIKKNDSYERTVYEYGYNESILDYNFDDLFEMTKEEIDELLIPIDCNTIIKDKLTSEDLYYQNETLIITHSYKLNDDVKEVYESSNDNTLFLIIYILISMGLSVGNSKLKKKYIKDNIRNKLKFISQNNRIITRDGINLIESIISIKKENLELLDLSAENISEDYQRKLLRK